MASMWVCEQKSTSIWVLWVLWFGFYVNVSILWQYWISLTMPKDRLMYVPRVLYALKICKCFAHWSLDMKTEKRYLALMDLNDRQIIFPFYFFDHRSPIAIGTWQNKKNLVLIPDPVLSSNQIDYIRIQQIQNGKWILSVNIYRRGLIWQEMI